MTDEIPYTLKMTVLIPVDNISFTCALCKETYDINNLGATAVVP